jgi:general secretion pathway protein A
MLLSRSLEQLRQRVIASYHLGPIARDETRRYIEHRLSLVGWQQDPRFDDDAFDEIYQWTSGIPRRINLLCNRLLLATYLAEGHDITAATVAKVAMEIRAEIGEPTVTRVDSLQSPLQEPLHVQEQSATAAMPQAPFNPLAGLMTAAPTEAPSASWALGNATVSPNDQHLLVVASSRSGCVRAAALQRAFAARNDLPPLRLLVINSADGFTLSGDWCEHMGLREPDFTLRVQGGSSATQLADVVRQTDHLLREYRPSGVIVQGGDDAALAVALTAHRQQLPIIHLEGGLRSFDRTRATEINAMMCDHIADLLLTSEWVAHDNLSREGVSSDRVHFVGNLIMDSLRAMLPQASPPKYTLRQFNLPMELLKHKQGYGVVYLENTLDAGNPALNQQLTSVLKSIARDMPLIWVCSPRTQALLAQQHLLEGVDPNQFALLPIIPYFKMIGLVGTAACVLTDAMPVQEEATIMGIPCLTLQNYTERRITVEQGTNIAVGLNSSIIHRSVAEIMRGGGKKGRLPKFWDGLTGGRMAEVLATWRKQQGARTTPTEKRA